ncbi:MAG TPA: hypothetical protein VEL51_21055 [Vicinamibacterales bacterium]|nr:hypothetical protein [Vicinamibacterales bacterium]
MSLIEHLERQIQVLVLAAHDMEEVIAACDALDREEAPSPLRDALATAIAVCYARPFSARNTVGPRLSKQWTPASGTPEREIHDWLLHERKKRYAHTDMWAGRVVLHAGDLENGFDGLIEIKAPFPRERLIQIRERATCLHEQLMAEAFVVQGKIVEEAG